MLVPRLLFIKSKTIAEAQLGNIDTVIGGRQIGVGVMIQSCSQAKAAVNHAQGQATLKLSMGAHIRGPRMPGIIISQGSLISTLSIPKLNSMATCNTMAKPEAIGDLVVKTKQPVIFYVLLWIRQGATITPARVIHSAEIPALVDGNA